MERLRYDPAAGTVACHTAKKAPDEDGRFDSPTVSSALDWLAALVTHIPDKGQ
jgi:hypothetical protein